MSKTLMIDMKSHSVSDIGAQAFGSAVWVEEERNRGLRG